MGYGFPAAIGAQVGCPDLPVFAICGDGGFQMTLQELAPAVEHKLPIKIALMNNKYLGMVRQWQELFWNGRYSGVDISVQPDFTKLAEAYGAAGIRVEKMEDVDGALQQAMANKRQADHYRLPHQPRGKRLPDDHRRPDHRRNDGQSAQVI